MERFADRPFAIVGVNTDSAESYARNLESEPVTWRSVMDGSTGGPVASKWGVTSFPTLYLLDHEGRIVVKDGRLRNDAWLEEQLEELVAGAEAASGGSSGAPSEGTEE